MGKFNVTGPDGRKFVVEGPDEAGAKAAVQRRYYSQPTVGVGEDVARSIPSGLKTGTEMLAGGQGDMGRMQGGAMARIAKALGFGDEGQKTAETIGTYANPLSMASLVLKGTEALGITKPVGPAPTTQQVTQKVETAFPASKKLDYTPQTLPGKYAKTMAEYVPQAAAGPWKGLASRIGWGLASGAGSETAGQLTEGSGWEPWARMAGGILPVAPSIVSDLFLRKGPVEPRISDFEKEHGIKLTAGQATKNPSLQTIESELGGNRYNSQMSNQRAALTGRAMELAGAPPGTRATPENMESLYDSLGGQYDQLARTTSIPMDQWMLNDLIKPLDKYRNLIGPASQAPAVENAINNAFDLAMQNGGKLSGEQFQALTSELKTTMRSSTSPEARTALREIVEALNNGIGRNLTPDLQAQWATLNDQYKNFKTVERAIAQGPAHNAQPGEIAPAGLRTAVRTSGGSSGQSDVAQSRTPMADLANKSAEVMTTPPNSNTAGRTAARTIPATVGAVFGGAPGAAAGALAGFGGAAVMSPLIMGDMMQNVMRLPPDQQRYLLSLFMSGQQGAQQGHR
jgi:hypothetical protein